MRQEAATANRIAREYADVFTTAESVVAFWQQSFLDVLPTHNVAAALTTSIRKTIALALLSTTRLHRVQAAASLRQITELTTLAAYCMSHPEKLRKTYDADLDHAALTKTHRSTSDAAYKWIGTSYPEQSALLFAHKSQINDIVSHANILHSAFTFDYLNANRTGFSSSFFDIERPDIVRSGLIEVAQIGCLSAITLIRVNMDTKSFLIDDERLSELDRLTEQMWKLLAQLWPEHAARAEQA